MSALLELALFAILAAATAVGFVIALRQVHPVSAWNERGTKPWACDLCMSFWSTLAVCALAAVLLDPERLWSWMPAFAIAYPWLARVNPIPSDGPDPGVPEPPTSSPARGDPHARDDLQG